MNYWKKKKDKSRIKFGLKIILLFFLLLFLSQAKYFFKSNFLAKIFKGDQAGPIFISPLSTQKPTEILRKQLEIVGVELKGLPVENEEELIATLSSGTTVYFRKNENYLQKLPSLQLILKNIKIEGRWPVKIDLRYSRSIIGY